jgi:hypothetical protein
VPDVNPVKSWPGTAVILFQLRLSVKAATLVTNEFTADFNDCPSRLLSLRITVQPTVPLNPWKIPSVTPMLELDRSIRRKGAVNKPNVAEASVPPPNEELDMSTRSCDPPN